MSCRTELAKGWMKGGICFVAGGASIAIPVPYLRTALMSSLMLRGVHELLASTPSALYEAAKNRSWQRVTFGMAAAGGVAALGELLDGQGIHPYGMFFGLVASVPFGMVVAYEKWRCAPRYCPETQNEAPDLEAAIPLAQIDRA